MLLDTNEASFHHYYDLLGRDLPVTNKTGTGCLLIKERKCLALYESTLPRCCQDIQATNCSGLIHFYSRRLVLLSPVKPNPPEKLTVVIMEDNSYPFLRMSWEPPHKADTRSGWITLIYEIRVKMEGRNDWEVRTCFGLSA